MLSRRSIQGILGLALAAPAVGLAARADDPPPVQMTAQEDHKRMMGLLNIKTS